MIISKIRNNINKIVNILIVLGFLLVINYFANISFFRIDLTDDKRYTITDASKKILSQLDDIVSIEVYFSKKLPTHLISLQRDVDDMLNEYKAYSHGNITYRFLYPDDDEELQRKIRMLGIPELQMNVIEKDKREIVKGYLGMAIFYADKKEIIPVVQSTGNLEYDLTSKIVKITRDETIQIGILDKHNDRDIEESYEIILKELRKQYVVRILDLRKDYKPIDQKIKTLAIINAENIDQYEKVLIDQYVMNGGNLLICQDLMTIDQKMQPKYLESNLDDLLLNYGLKLNQEIVLDKYHTMASFSSGFMSFTMPYPFWVKVINKNMTADLSIVNKLEAVVFPWVGTINILESNDTNVKYIPFMQSSEVSWVQQRNQVQLNPQQRFNPNPNDFQKRNIGVIASGIFKSLYDGKDFPQAPDTALAAFPPDGLIKRNTSIPAKIIFIADGDFMVNRNIQMFGADNKELFLNSIDYLSLGDELISIRSRHITDRPLDEDIKESDKTLIKAIMMFIIPLLMIIFGILRYLLRRARANKVIML